MFPTLLRKSAKFIILLQLLVVSKPSWSQKTKSDSLLYAINHSADKGKTLDLLITYCTEYKYELPDSCLKYTTIYFDSESNTYTDKKIALVLLIGDIYWHIGDLETSIKKYEFALDFYKKSGNKKGISQALGDIGYVKMEQGNYPEALVSYKESLKIARELGDEEYIGVVGTYIAQLYNSMGEYAECLKMYHEMKSYFAKTKNKKNYGVVLMNIGGVHTNCKNLDSALIYYDLAMQFLPLEEEKSRAIVKLNVAYIYIENKKDLRKAKLLIDETVPVFEKYNSKSNLALADHYYGRYYLEIKDYAKAKALFEKAIAHFKTENNYARLSLLYEYLAITHEKLNEVDSAYAAYKLYKQTNDSVLNQLSANSMSYQRVMFDTDKKQLEIKTLEQKQLIQKAQLGKEKTQRYAMIVGILFLILFGLFMVNRFKVIKRQNAIIQQKEQETQIQKHLIEEKQRAIIDSINYAKRIQQSQLPTEKYIEKSIKRLKKD